MKINIKGYEFELHYSLRTLINYEAAMNKPLEPEDMKNITNFVVLFFSCIMASAAYHKIQLNLTYDEFMSWLDDNGGTAKILEFGMWYKEATEAESMFIRETNTTEEGSEDDGKKP